MDSPSLIVARYLKAHDFSETYAAFLGEAGLPPEAGEAKAGQLDLETLLDEKAAFDLTLRTEKLGLNDGSGLRWTLPAPKLANVVHTLQSKANVLNVLVHGLGIEDSIPSVHLIASTADKRLYFIDPSSLSVRRSLLDVHDSPILSFAVLEQRDLLTSSMSGQLRRSNAHGHVIERRQDHSKYVVKVITSHVLGTNKYYVATAGWDSKVLIYAVDTSTPDYQMDSPIATLILPTKPEAMAFARHPDSGKTVLLLSRTDSSFIYFYRIDESAVPPTLLGKQNLAPHSNAWVAFTPSAFQVCPTDSSLLAIATSSVPHMKLLIVRLLFPPWDLLRDEDAAPGLSSLSKEGVPGGSDSIIENQTQATQARAALALAEREDAAIQINCNTMAPQTAYSTPTLARRPDGSGVWVNGDDGTVRGIEACSGKVIHLLQGHDVGSKVRCLWAGKIRNTNGDGDDEIVVSGGFDQKLIVWRCS